MDENNSKLKPYIEALPTMARYSIVIALILEAWLFVLGRLFRAVLDSTGRVAVTSGDWTFLFTSWQGLAIILLALFSLSVYVALDLNAKIILAGDLLHGRKKSLWQTMKEALNCIPELLHFQGILILLYIVLIAPIIGMGFSVALTRGLYIPTFISSFIAETPLYLVLTTLAVIIFIIVGLANMFIMHGIVLDKLSIKEASQQSKELMKHNWKDYIRQNLIFVGIAIFVVVVFAVFALVIPVSLIDVLPLGTDLKRGLLIFFMLTGVLASALAALAAIPLYVMRITQLFYKYKEGVEPQYEGKKLVLGRVDKIGLAFIFVAAICASVVLAKNFDSIFPEKSNVQIIAHRAGGVEAPENTVKGIMKAWDLDAMGAEIDIQRTKDGHYIVNHDGDFKRVAGDSRKPQDMTLEEIKQLRVDGEPVATFEEILQASKGRLTLFIELKGATADIQMCEEAMRIVKTFGMQDQVVFISLDYKIIDYIETNYSDMKTGFLTFAAFGDTARLNCDYLGLEEESATVDTVASIHKQGKKVLVWTVNKKTLQRHFLCSQADAIITDNISQANEIVEILKNRSDLMRIIDAIRVLI